MQFHQNYFQSTRDELVECKGRYLSIKFISIFYVFLKALGKFAFQLLNGVGDYLTIQDVLNPKGLPDWDKMEENEIFTRASIH